MRYEKALQNKYQKAKHEQKQIKAPPVAATLSDFLQNQSYRIEMLVYKKRQQQKKLMKISTDRIKYREELKDKIDQNQSKHAHNRQDIIGKKVKATKFQLSQIQRRRNQYLTHRRQQNKANQQKFRRTHSQTKKYWEDKAQQIKKRNQLQTMSPTLYEDSINRKRSLQLRNIAFGQTVKDRFMLKHNNINEKVGYLMLKQKQKNELMEAHISETLEKKQAISQKKQLQFINNICRSIQKSQMVEKKNKKEWQKKMKTRQLIQYDLLSRTKQNYNQRALKTAKSLKQCRCHSKGKIFDNSTNIMTRSININNEQEQEINKRRGSFLNIKNMRESFLKSSKLMKGSVLNNKLRLREQQQAKQQRQIMKEKQIIQAVKMRNALKSDSNMFIREARLNA